MAAVNYFGPKTILLKYGCLRPCEFYEFKVTILETFTVEKKYIVMLAGERAIDDANPKKFFRNKSFVVWTNFIYRERGVGLPFHYIIG